MGTVTCPFCALHCDDLVVHRSGDRLNVTNSTCPKALQGFGGFTDAGPSSPAPHPSVAGRPVAFEEAVAAAASLLRHARAPLYAGLGGDVAAIRAILSLARRTGGIVDHLHGDAMTRNLLAMQDSGWMMTTLTEVRNRADLIVLVGTNASAYPRFYERCVWNPRRLGRMDTRPRELVYLGAGLETELGTDADGRRPTHIDCDPRHLGELVGAVGALAAGRQLTATTVAGVRTSTLQALVERMRVARYGVVVWAAAAFAFPHAELVVQRICDLVRTLNETTRFGGLALGGDDGGTTATSVCTWQTGYPSRVSFASESPVYEPTLHATATLLAREAVDRVLWLSSFSPRHLPPVTAAPLVALGHPAQSFTQAPAVFIPVATPGLDHAGQVFRCDAVVSLPLARLRHSTLHEASQVVRAIDQRLG